LSGSLVRLAACSGGKVGVMADTTNSESFEAIVEWAYSTLPKKIRDLPDFPGIQAETFRLDRHGGIDREKAFPLSADFGKDSAGLHSTT